MGHGLMKLIPCMHTFACLTDVPNSMQYPMISRSGRMSQVIYETAESSTDPAGDTVAAAVVRWRWMTSWAARARSSWWSGSATGWWGT